MSSRLFKRMREELGAAYYVGAGVDLLLDHGELAIAAGIDQREKTPGNRSPHGSVPIS